MVDSISINRLRITKIDGEELWVYPSLTIVSGRDTIIYPELGDMRLQTVNGRYTAWAWNGSVAIETMEDSRIPFDYEYYCEYAVEEALMCINITDKLGSMVVGVPMMFGEDKPPIIVRFEQGEGGT